eukprot:scaffold2199_cov120-Skeletonema_dohrnii-CCMP3373.AAC.8
MMKKKYPLRSNSILLLFSFIISLLLPQCTHSFATQPSTQTPTSPSTIITPTDIHFPILYENEHLLAISKPPHIPHHDDPQSNQLGIISLLRHQQQQQSSFSYPHRLYGVHRLDRVTSGILLLAKSSDIANTLVNKFKEREVTKYYMAISGKKPRKKKQGWVRGDMVLGRRGSYKLVNENNNKKVEDDVGKRSNYAVTRFFTAGLGNVPLSPLLHPKVNEEEQDSSTTPKTAILFQPHTGKTHQLRVAAKSVGLPILGDARYGGGRVRASDDDTTTEADFFDRTYLHAAAIQFEIDNEEVCIYSPPPFGHLFTSSSVLDDVFVGMMKKHCESDSILHHVDGRSML